MSSPLLVNQSSVLSFHCLRASTTVSPPLPPLVMPMYSLLREYPWLRPYWYAALGILAVAGVMMILWDGRTQVAKGRRRAAKLQQQQRQKQRTLAEGGATAGTAVTVDAGSEDKADGREGTQLRRPPRKAVS